MKVIAALACLTLFAPISIQAIKDPRQNGKVQQQGQGRFLKVAGVQGEQEKIDPTKEADIRHLQEVMGGDQLAAQVMEELVKNMKPTLSRILPPGDYRDKLIDLFIEKFRSKLDPHQLMEIGVPLYDKYFSDEEIKGLTTFYATPLGKKTLTVLPKLAGEANAAGSKLGEEIGRQSMIEVLNEHPELKKAIEEAGKPKQDH